jgi:transposase
MSKSRRTYSAEFKLEAVQLTHEPGRTVGEVAAGLGVDRSLLQRWRSELKRDGGEAFPGQGRPKAADEELLRVKKELARTQQERDILKKALAYFASARS